MGGGFLLLLYWQTQPTGPVIGPGPGPFRAITASVAVARGTATASRATARDLDPTRSTARPYG
jgi:hypothetical protein